MATRIIEYGGGERGDVLPADKQTVVQPALTAPAISQAFCVGTNLVCIQTDEAVHVAFGVSPTATTNDYKILAGSEQFFSVKAGWRVSIV